MQLVRMKTDDISQIARWNIELHEDEASTAMLVDNAEARLRKWYTDDSFQALLISVEGRSVGYLLYQLRPPTPDIRGSTESIYIRQFYINRDVRRIGYGKNAIDLFTQQVLNDDQSLHLDVKVTNPGGQKFWESLGFVAEHVAYTRDPTSIRRAV